ncbi:DUF3906 family protein [Peribacillus sp. SCS-155]|uniref:DUF3906 family protein n=1 Tax=Peribacillus sedimenti TaxID=3115297 RepID=UPI0039059078
MNLYRFEVALAEGPIHVIIAAENDDAAFRLVDIELEKHYLSMPDVKDVSLYEKKKIRKGTGFVLSQLETAL